MVIALEYCRWIYILFTPTSSSNTSGDKAFNYYLFIVQLVYVGLGE